MILADTSTMINYLRGNENDAADCLIAQTVIENNLYLLHSDSDFDNIAKVINLRIFRL